jgi:hypothetical protein
MIDNTTCTSHTHLNHSEQNRQLSERQLLVARSMYAFCELFVDLGEDVSIGCYELEWRDDHGVFAPYGGEFSWTNIKKCLVEGVLLIRLSDGVWRECPKFSVASDKKLRHWLDEEDIGDWRDVLKRHGVWSLSAEVMSSVAKGHRSDIIFKIGRTLAERGASEREIVVVLLAAKCFVSKWGNSAKAARREARRIMTWRKR